MCNSNYCDDIEMGPAMLSDYAAKWDENELAAELTKLRVPLFVVHGECDDAIPISDAASFFLNVDHNEKDFWRVPEEAGGDHRLNKPVRDVYTRMSAFLEQSKL